MSDYTWDEFMEQVYTPRGWRFNPVTLYEKVVTQGKLDIVIQDSESGKVQEKITIRTNPCNEDVNDSSAELNDFLANFITQGVMV